MYIAYKIISFFILDSQLTYDDAKPQLKLSQLVNIDEGRIKYSLNFYIMKDFAGFNAFIDKHYFVTATKLGKVTEDYKILKSNKRPDDEQQIVPFIPSDVEDSNGRYIN